MRNPFPTIGKIIKYEFKHSARIILPLFGILLALGLLTGLSVNGKNVEKIIDESVNGYSSNFSMTINDQRALGLVTGFLLIAVTALTVAVIVVTLVTLDRRFNKSMLGEEAYLNLSLPATMGEQLWGRFIMDFLWMFCAVIVIFLTLILCFIRMNLPSIFRHIFQSIPEFNEAISNQNVNIGGFIATIIISIIASICWIIGLIFVVNAISHLFKSKKEFIKFLIILGLIFINGKISNLFFPNFNNYMAEAGNILWARTFIKSTLLSSLQEFVWTDVYFGFTHFVFTKKLNLE